MEMRLLHIRRWKGKIRTTTNSVSARCSSVRAHLISPLGRYLCVSGQSANIAHHRVVYFSLLLSVGSRTRGVLPLSNGAPSSVEKDKRSSIEISTEVRGRNSKKPEKLVYHLFASHRASLEQFFIFVPGSMTSIEVIGAGLYNIFRETDTFQPSLE